MQSPPTPTTAALFTYPIKSCAPLSHSRIELDTYGPLWDRYWMIVDEDGEFLTQREVPTMALIQPAFEDSCLRLSAPSMPTAYVPLQALQPSRLSPYGETTSRLVTVWRDTCQAWDEGDELAMWLSDFMHLKVRLVRMADDYRRGVDSKFAPQPAETRFTDGFPLLIVSEASLDELNNRLVERRAEPVPMGRFRPNLVVTGCDAFAEDTWRTVQIGSVILDIVKPCARCVLTTVDPKTGTVPDPAEPLATLNTFRKRNGKVMFAQNAIHRAPGTLVVGDHIDVITLRDTPL
jgi:uncharacterized protein